MATLNKALLPRPRGLVKSMLPVVRETRKAAPQLPEDPQAEASSVEPADSDIAQPSLFDDLEIEETTKEEGDSKACDSKETEKAMEVPGADDVEPEEEEDEPEGDDTEKALDEAQTELDLSVEEVEKALKACYSDTYKAPEKYSHIDFTPPESVQSAAERGLEIRAEASPSNRGGLTSQEAGKQGIGSGVSRASQLKRGSKVSPEVIGQMVNFFNRHEAYKHKHKSEPKGKARQSWLLWGGDAGRSWANKVKRQMEAADKKDKGE